MPPSATRLWPAILLFAGFALGAFFAPELADGTDSSALARSRAVLTYLVEMGVWLSGAFMVVRLLNVFVWDGVVARATDGAVPRLVKDCLALVVYLIAVAGILGMVFGKSVTGLWATSGAITIVLGLALRSIILDIFTGLAVNVDRSYRIGEWIEIAEAGQAVLGQVIEINWRTTRIDLTDGRTLVVPNSRMGTIPLTNYTMLGGVARFEFPVVLDFSVPSERAIRVLQAGAKAAVGGVGLVAHPEPKVIVAGPTVVGVEYRVRYWLRVADLFPAAARDIVARSVLRHLERAGLSLAYPKQDVFHARLPSRQLDHHSEDDRAKLLRGVELFGPSLTDDELRRLSHAMTPRAIPAGTVLLTAGEPGASMLVLAEGLLEVWTAHAGERVRVAQVGPGDFVGEMSLLTGEPRSADVVAATDCLAYEITRDHLTPLLDARPELFEAISQRVVERRLRTSHRLAEADTPQALADTRTASSQIVRKMRLFFGRVFDRQGAAGA